MAARTLTNQQSNAIAERGSFSAQPSLPNSFHGSRTRNMGLSDLQNNCLVEFR